MPESAASASAQATLNINTTTKRPVTTTVISENPRVLLISDGTFTNVCRQFVPTSRKASLMPGYQPASPINLPLRVINEQGPYNTTARKSKITCESSTTTNTRICKACKQYIPLHRRLPVRAPVYQQQLSIQKRRPTDGVPPATDAPLMKISEESSRST